MVEDEGLVSMDTSRWMHPLEMLRVEEISRFVDILNQLCCTMEIPQVWVTETRGYIDTIERVFGTGWSRLDPSKTLKVCNLAIFYEPVLFLMHHDEQENWNEQTKDDQKRYEESVMNFYLDMASRPGGVRYVNVITLVPSRLHYVTYVHDIREKTVTCHDTYQSLGVCKPDNIAAQSYLAAFMSYPRTMAPVCLLRTVH